MKWNPNSIPDTTDLPPGNYDCEIENIDESQSKAGKKLMYTLSARVREPREYAGMNITDWILIGTDDCPMPDVGHADPRRRKLATAAWNRNGPKLKQVFNALKLKDLGDDVDDAIKASIRQRIGVTTTLQEETALTINSNGETERRGTGNFRSRVARNGYFTIGAREIGLAGDLSAAPTRPRYTNGEDTEAAAEVDEALPPPPPRAARPQPTRSPVRPASRFSEEDE